VGNPNNGGGIIVPALKSKAVKSIRGGLPPSVNPEFSF